MRVSSRLKGPRGRGKSAIGSEARSAEDSLRSDPKAPFISKALAFHVLLMGCHLSQKCP